MPQVLVVGAQGVLGSLIARAFAVGGWEVTRAGRRPEEADDFRLLDLGDRAAVAAAVEEADLIANTAHHPALHLERAVLRNGGILLDVCDLSPGERQVLREEGSEGGGLVTADAGLSGVAYLALADLLADHPQAEESQYALMFSAAGSSGRGGALLGHRLLTGARHHTSRRIGFPRPWGAQRVFDISDGAGILTASVAGIPLRHYLAMQPRSLRALLGALNAAHLISLLPAATFTAGTGKVPDEPSTEPICEWVGVASGGEPLAARTIQGRGYYEMTANAMLSFAETLIGRPRPEHGFWALEDLIALPEIAAALERRGIAVAAADA